ncbi:MAG: hypothetical protein WC774_01795 [Candidatus Gracilibacteria bacterium]
MSLETIARLFLISDIKNAINVIYNEEDLGEKYRLRTVFILDGRLCRLEQYFYKDRNDSPQNILDDRRKLTPFQIKRLLKNHLFQGISDDKNIDFLLDTYYSILNGKGFISTELNFT